MLKPRYAFNENFSCPWVKTTEFTLIKNKMSIKYFIYVPGRVLAISETAEDNNASTKSKIAKILIVLL